MKEEKVFKDVNMMSSRTFPDNFYQPNHHQAWQLIKVKLLSDFDLIKSLLVFKYFINKLNGNKEVKHKLCLSEGTK